MRRFFRSRSTLLLASLIAGCSSPPGFRLRFSDQPTTQVFQCELQSIHPQKRPAIQVVEKPGRTSLTLQDGESTVLWLYHFVGEPDNFRNDEYAYTIALELRDLRIGRWEIPAKEVGITFFCDNWGRGFKAAELHATRGFVRIKKATERAISGELELTFLGYKERSDKTRESLELSLSGEFHASR